jgi:hypothetical protein
MRAQKFDCYFLEYLNTPLFYASIDDNFIKIQHPFKF